MDKDLAQHTKDSKIKETIKQDNPANQDKTIGVVIPIYNVAPYLRECLDSVINQTYKNLSIVLVNDGSTDNNESLNIAKEYVSKDSRFILIDKENGGQSTARNVGIEWFKNKYQTKLDSIESISNTINQDSIHKESTNNTQIKPDSINTKSLNNKANITNQNNKNTINDNSYNYGGGGGNY